MRWRDHRGTSEVPVYAVVVRGKAPQQQVVRHDVYDGRCGGDRNTELAADDHTGQVQRDQRQGDYKPGDDARLECAAIAHAVAVDNAGGEQGKDGLERDNDECDGEDDGVDGNGNSRREARNGRRTMIALPPSAATGVDRPKV